jgi:putative redox protein
VINDRPGTADEIRADLQLDVQWRGEHRFSAGKKGAPPILIDGHAKDGPSPPEALLASLASCTAVDVVEILTKRRTPPHTLDIDVLAERATGTPRRVTKVHLGYRIVGAGIDRSQAERAIELAVTKYCTVRDSLDPALPVTWSLDLREP